MPVDTLYSLELFHYAYLAQEVLIDTISDGCHFDYSTENNNQQKLKCHRTKNTITIDQKDTEMLFLNVLTYDVLTPIKEGSMIFITVVF
mgnify:CR=1 FL=1